MSYCISTTTEPGREEWCAFGWDQKDEMDKEADNHPCLSLRQFFRRMNLAPTFWLVWLSLSCISRLLKVDLFLFQREAAFLSPKVSTFFLSVVALEVDFCWDQKDEVDKEADMSASAIFLPNERGSNFFICFYYWFLAFRVSFELLCSGSMKRQHFVLDGYRVQLIAKACPMSWSDFNVIPVSHLGGYPPEKRHFLFRVTRTHQGD